MAVELVLCCLVEHTVPSPANGHTPDDLKRNAETVGVFHQTEDAAVQEIRLIASQQLCSMYF